MTTMAPEDVDSELLGTLDFDYAENCDVWVAPKTECEKPAEWVLTLACCGRKMLMCDGHFQKLLEDMNLYEGFYDGEDTGGCGNVVKRPIAAARRLDKH